MALQNEIGGYFELELQSGHEFHSAAMRFNSARNALCYYLIKNKIKHLFVPYYITENLVEALHRIKTECHFYHIDKNFNPLLKSSHAKLNHVLLVNYFGICEQTIKENSDRYKNVIADYAQSFFSTPENNIPTFYSPRKFFGVADGGYLYANDLDNNTLAQDKSAQRYISRLVRLDSGAEAGHFIYHNTEELLNREKIRRMSTLTQKILSSFRYDQVWEQRENNFRYLHKHLGSYNLLDINLQSVHGPMVYPFMSVSGQLQPFLVENKIYASRFWPDVTNRVDKDTFEYKLSTTMCGLPIDQRYGKNEMNIIINAVKSFIEKKRETIVRQD